MKIRIMSEFDFLDKYDPRNTIMFPDGSRHNGNDLHNKWISIDSLKEWMGDSDKVDVKLLLKKIDEAQNG